MRKGLKKGFTLIELLVVIAIIAILATVVIINVTGARAKAARAKIAADLDVAVKSYAACNSFEGVVVVAPITGQSTGAVATCTTTNITDTVEKAAATGTWPKLPSTTYGYVDSNAIGTGHTCASAGNPSSPACTTGIAEIQQGVTTATPTATTNPYITCTVTGCSTGNVW